MDFLTSLIPAPYRLLALALLVVACMGFGFIKGEMSGSGRVQARWDAASAQRDKLTGEAIARQRAKILANDAALQAAADQHLKELQHAQRETNQLRDCVRDGTCGLRINAVCPAATGRLEEPSAAGLDPGTGARLAPSAERAYFALRDGIDSAQSKLSACQDELKIRTAEEPPGPSTQQAR